MKRYLLFLLLIIAFASCKKDKKQSPSLAGTWEIRAISLADGGGIIRSFSPGNDTIVKFTANTYENYIDGQLISNGTYKAALVKGYSETTYRITYDNSPGAGPIYRLKGNKVTFSPEITILTSTSTTYERIK